MKISIITTFILILINSTALAKPLTIKGHIYIQNKQQPLLYAAIENKTSKSFAYSNENGFFEIQANMNDSLVCRYLGCTDKIIPIHNNDSIIDVYLQEEATNLKEVEIVSRRRPIQMSSDGLVVNMSAIRKDGKLLSDVLTQLPTIKVKSNMITMAGKNKVLVYLNNHQVYLSGEDLMSYLNSLGLENINKINIISTPPTKYESEGNVGILKIETSKKINPGWQGRILGKAQQAHYQSGGASARFIYSGKNFSISNTILASYADEYVHSKYTNYFGDYLVATDCPKQNKNKVITTLTSVNLDIDAKNDLSLTLQLPWMNRDNNRDINNITKYYKAGNSDVDSLMISKGNGKTKNYQSSGELNYEHIFTENSDFDVTFGYINNHIDNNREWNSQTLIASNAVNDEDFYSLGHQNYNIYTFKTNFSNAYNNWNFSEGYKFSYTNSTSYNEKSECLDVNYPSSNLFGYKELVNALYINAAGALKAITLNFGLRAELTHIQGTSYSLNEINKNHYLKLFPVVSLKYEASDNNIFAFDYSKRIKRPDFELLDPFRWYTSKYDYSVGDPFLKPAYINNVSLSYMHGNNFYAKLYFTNTNKDFENMVILNKDNLQYQVEQAGNYLNISELGLDTEYTMMCGSWFESTMSGLLTYSSFMSNYQAFNNVKGWGCELTMNNHFYINKHFTSSVSIEDDVPGCYNYRKVNNSLLYNVEFSYTNAKKDFVISFNANDLLRTSSPKYHYYSNGIRQEFDNYYDSQFLGVTVIKKFGNVFNKVKKMFESSNSEEKSRL